MPAVLPPSWVSCRRDPQRRWLTVLLAGALLVATGGCARPGDWVQANPDIATRAREDPRSFVTAAYARWDGLQGLGGSYQVRASRGISSRTIDTQFHLLRDAMVEIQVLSPTGSSEGYVAVGRSEVGLWMSDENILYRGPNQPGAFGRALGVDLSPTDVVAVLMGYGVRIDGTETVDWDANQQRIRVRNHGVTAWLHPVLAVFDRVLVETASGPIEVEYSEWSTGDVPVPLQMRVRVSSEDINLDLRLAPAWVANPEGLDDDYFDILIPTGAALGSLDRLSAEGGLLRRGLER